jgi:hypothetical protein
MPAHVSAGERLRLRIKGVVDEPLDGMRASVGVRVRSLPREEIVFTAHSAQCGVDLPACGEFALDLDLQMNVVAGTYRAQAVAWDVRDARELDRGPAVLIGVGGLSTASGPVFPDARIRLVAP